MNELVLPACHETRILPVLASGGFAKPKGSGADSVWAEPARDGNLLIHERREERTIVDERPQGGIDKMCGRFRQTQLVPTDQIARFG